MTDAASSDGIASASAIWTWRSYRVDNETARRELRRAALMVMIFLGLLTAASVAVVRPSGAAAAFDAADAIRPTPERAL